MSQDLQLDSNHAAEALARFAQQFKDKPNFAAFLGVFTNQVQVLENAIYDLAVKRWLSSATGAQLDLLGRIVGQPRDNSVDDTEYRVRIQARILTNKSDGTMRAVYAIFQVLLPSVNTYFQPGYPAGFTFYINTVITSAYATLYAGFLAAAHAAGVWGNLIWYPATDPLMFFTETSAWFMSTTYLAGVSSFNAFGPTAPPASGSLVLGEGTLTQETVAFTASSYSAGVATFTLSVPTAHAHNTNGVVALVGTPGLGFGDTNNSATGGELAGAIAV